MKYPNIKAAHLSHAEIAKAFGYRNVKSFRCSSAHKRHMQGVDEIIGTILDKLSLGQRINFEVKTLAEKQKR